MKGSHLRGRARRYVFIGAMAVACGSAVAVPAQARQQADTWTVSPGGALTAAAPAQITNVTRGWTINCDELRVSGTAKSGAGNTGDQILAIEQASFSGCTGPDGLGFTVTNDSALMEMQATSFDAATGKTAGSMFGFQLNLLATNRCQADVADPNGDLGTADASFTNNGSVLGLGGGTMGVTFVNFACSAGFVAVGDSVVLSTQLPVSPAQAITSP